jgi:hypothetical protein
MVVIARESTKIRVQFHNVTSKFPVNWNRE